LPFHPNPLGSVPLRANGLGPLQDHLQVVLK
jgi:hypothetical protein